MNLLIEWRKNPNKFEAFARQFTKSPAMDLPSAEDVSFVSTSTYEELLNLYNSVQEELSECAVQLYEVEGTAEETQILEFIANLKIWREFYRAAACR